MPDLLWRLDGYIAAAIILVLGLAFFGYLDPVLNMLGL